MPRPAVLAAAALGGAGVLAVRAARRRRPPAWHSVTVLAEPGAIDLAGPLGELRSLDVRLVSAPGDRGTEVHARYRRPATPARTAALRAALRDTKSLTEIGEVVRAVPRPHGYRRRTPWGLAQDALERRAKGLGLG